MSERRVALITGSSSGIGAAVARRLAADGIRIVVNSARSAAAGEALAAELPDAVYVQADVADPADARRIVQSAVDAYGRLDILVNNAGATRFIPLDDLQAADAAAWREIFDVNLFGVWQLTTAAVPHLQQSDAAVIVNISSVSATRALGSSIPYAVSKAALNHLTRLLATQLGPRIRVNAIAPGLTDTAQPRYGESEEQLAVRAASLPLGRMGTPEEIANVAAFLASDKASFITGQVLHANGGLFLAS
jgi:ketoreductase RED2